MARLHQQPKRVTVSLLPGALLQGNRGAIGTIQSLLQVLDRQGHLILQFLAELHVPDSEFDGSVLQGHWQYDS